MKCDNCMKEIMSGERFNLKTHIYENDPLSNHDIRLCIECAEEQGLMPNVTAGGLINTDMVNIAAALHNRPLPEKLKDKGITARLSIGGGDTDGTERKTSS